MMNRFKYHALKKALSVAIVVSGISIYAGSTYADETSCSPFTPLVKGQEDFVYVWTLGMKGVGDESDKLVKIDLIFSSDFKARAGW